MIIELREAIEKVGILLNLVEENTSYKLRINQNIHSIQNIILLKIYTVVLHLITVLHMARQTIAQAPPAFYFETTHVRTSFHPRVKLRLSFAHRIRDFIVDTKYLVMVLVRRLFSNIVCLIVTNLRKSIESRFFRAYHRPDHARKSLRRKAMHQIGGSQILYIHAYIDTIKMTL